MFFCFFPLCLFICLFVVVVVLSVFVVVVVLLLFFAGWGGGGLGGVNRSGFTHFPVDLWNISPWQGAGLPRLHVLFMKT